MTAPANLKKAVQRACDLIGHDVTLTEIRQGGKVYPLPTARKAVSAYLRALDPAVYTYPRIARMLRLKNHTSVLIQEREAHRLWGGLIFRSLARRDFPRPITAHVEVFTVNAKQIEAIGESHLRD